MKKNGKKDAQKNVLILSESEHELMLLKAVPMHLRRKFLN